MFQVDTGSCCKPAQVPALYESQQARSAAVYTRHSRATGTHASSVKGHGQRDRGEEFYICHVGGTTGGHSEISSCVQRSAIPGVC